MLKLQCTVHGSPVFTRIGVHGSKKRTCHRVLKSGYLVSFYLFFNQLVNFVLWKTLQQRKLHRPDFRDVDRLN